MYKIDFFDMHYGDLPVVLNAYINSILDMISLDSVTEISYKGPQQNEQVLLQIKQSESFGKDLRLRGVVCKLDFPDMH